MPTTPCPSCGSHVRTWRNGICSDRWHAETICTATLLQKDDRWGGFELRCEKPVDHPDAWHQHTMTGCEPVAKLVWLGSYSSTGLPNPGSLEGHEP